MRRVLVAVGLAVVLGLAGCATPTTAELTAGVLDEAGMEVDSAWELASGEVDGAPLTLLEDHPITLLRTADGIRGQSSCNGYVFAPVVDATPDATSSGRPFADIANSEAACPNQAVMELEDLYLSALRRTTEVKVDGAALRLTGPESVLVFDRRGTGAGGGHSPSGDDTSDPGRTGGATPDTGTTAAAGDPVATLGTWALETATVDGIDLDLAGGRRVDLTASDGQMGGRATCNDYGATYTVDRDRIHVQVTAVTEVGCPGARMDLEAAYLDALGRVTTVEQSDRRLTLSGDGVKLTFTEEAPLAGDELVGTRWELEVVARGTTTTTAEGDGFLLFAEDGTMTGSTGCRALDGEWTRNGSSLVFPSLGARGDCVAGLEDQDRAVTGVLENPLVTLDGDRLTLEGPGGAGPDTPALVYRATPAPDRTAAPGTGSDPTADPTRAGDRETTGDAAFAGTVFLWRTGGIAGLDESVTIRGDGLISVTSEDVGSGYQLDRVRLQSVATALDAFDWDGLAARARTDTTVDDAISWHVKRFDRVLDITDTQLPDPPPALLLEAASLMDEFAPEA